MPHNSGGRNASRIKLGSTPQPISRYGGRFIRWFGIFRVPFLVLTLQLCFLIITISLFTWTCKKNHYVPSSLSHLYIAHNQSSTTILTLFGSLLSLITAYFFAEAVRFAINVSLRKKKGLSLFTVYALHCVASKSPLLNWSSGRKRWVIVSVIYFVLFLAQTSAWTTVITPKQGPSILTTGTFQDFNFSTPVLEGGMLPILPIPLSTFLESSASGLAAIQNIVVTAGLRDPATSDVSQLLPFGDFVFNGTSFGILPQVPSDAKSFGWTNITAVQQGFTANVTCVETPGLDPAVNIQFANMTAFNTTYQAAMFTCVNDTNTHSPFITDPSLIKYSGIFTICPFHDSANVEETISLYLQMGGASFVDRSNNPVVVNMVCSIKPQILSIRVNYNGETGTMITFEPLWETLTYPSINTSAIVLTVIEDLDYHLSNSQSPDMNVIIEEIYDAYSLYKVDDNSPLNELMAGYVRGVIEYAATNARGLVLFNYTDSWDQAPRQLIETEIFQTVVSWGPSSPQYKMIVMSAPFALMLSTIVILLVSFHRARKIPLSADNLSLDLSSIVHLVPACSIGKLEPLKFHEESELYSVSKRVELTLRSADGLTGREGLEVAESEVGVTKRLNRRWYSE